MTDNLLITTVKNPFVKSDGREYFSLPFNKGFTVADLLDHCNIPIQNSQYFNVVINGHVCNNLYKVLHEGDSVIVVAKIQGGGTTSGGTKNIIGTVAMLAVMMVAMVAAPQIGGFMAMNMSLNLMSTTWTAIAAGAIIAGGSLLVNSLLPPPIQELESGFGGPGITKESKSPTYGFTGGQSSYTVGLPYPVLYGEYQLSGQILNHWIETDNGSFNQTLKTLMCMSEGLCKSPPTEKNQIMINDISLDSIVNSNFETTKGGQDQEAIQIGGFDKLHQYRNISYELDSGPYILLHGDEDPLTDSSYWEHTMAITSVARSNVQSKFGGYSMLFDAATDFLGWTENEHLHFEWNKNMTVTFWLRMTTQDSSHRNIFSQWYNSTNELRFGYYLSNKLIFYFVLSGATQVWITSKEDLVVDQWYYVELSKIGDWYYLFLDGVLQAKKSISVPHVEYWKNLPASCGLGKNPSSTIDSILGYVDEFQMTGSPGHSSDYNVPTEAPSGKFGLTVTTKGQVDEVNLTFEMNSGLFYINVDATLVENDVAFPIYYRKKGDADWILRSAILGYTSGGTATCSGGDIIEGNTSGATGEWSDYFQTSGDWSAGTSAGNPTLLTNPGGIFLKNITGIFEISEDLNNTTTGVDNIATLENTISELIHGEHLVEKERIPVRKAFSIENLDREIYEVNLMRLSPGEGDTQHVSNIFWTGLDEILNESLTYPGLSLLAISVEATEQIQGRAPSFKAIWDRGIIEVPDWFPVHTDYTTYTEVDPNSHISVLDWRVDFNGLDGDEDAYLYKDMGVDCFDGDFKFYLECELTSAVAGGVFYVFMLANLIADGKAIDVGNGSYLAVYLLESAGVYYLVINEIDSGAFYSDIQVISLDTKYYLTIRRDESASTHGTFYMDIYTDEARTTLLASKSVNLHTSKKDYRYLYGLNTWNVGGGGRDVVGYVENLRAIQEVESSNPAWACYDMLTNSIYGEQVAPLNINQTSWLDWVDWCDTTVSGIGAGQNLKRITCNGIFDVKASVSSALEKFQQLGRALILKTGQKIDVVVEKPVDNITELFSSGNIIEGTNELEFIERESKPDILDIKFRNASNNYEDSSVTIYCSDYNTIARVYNTESLNLWGCNNEDEARRYGLLRMQMNEKLNKLSTHESDVDAIGCQIGDVIYKEHESNSITYGGALEDQTGMNNFYIKLDQEINIPTSSGVEDYKIWIRYEDNTIVERYVRGPWDTDTDKFYIGALEDFEDDYTETDPNSHITVDGDDITFSNLTNAEDAYVYKDFGVDYFDGDFEHQIDGAEIDTYYGPGSVQAFIWALTNDIDDWKGLDDGGKDSLGIALYRVAALSTLKIILYENDGGTTYTDEYEILIDTKYYLTVKRDESVGTHGTLYCYIYSDEARTTLVDTLTLTLHTSKKDYRYLFGLLSYNSGGSEGIYGDVKNINISGLSGDQARFDIFSIGQPNYEVMTYRIMNLSRSVDTQFQIGALEYNEDIYSHSEYTEYI